MHVKLTVAEILCYPEFAGFRLIAGAGGVSNQITSVGILDYEYDRRLKDKYTKLSFIPNQMILTSLQYAKDDPGCIMDAIRLLARKKCSCLAIKNVYALPISAHTLHFADSCNFPVLLIDNSEQYFERIIVNTYKRIDNLYNFDKFENIIATILSLPEHHVRQKELQLELNPCLQTDLCCLYFRADWELTKDDYMKMEYAARTAGLLTSYNSLLRYKNGLLYLHSSDNFKNAKATELADAVLAGPVAELAGRYRIGVSAVHYKKRKLRLSMEEAIYASYFHQRAKQPYMAYDDLGITGILLPYCRESAMQHFASTILMPLRDYDAENNTLLLKTAVVFTEENGNIAAAAKALSQHANTIRYRLRQINSLLHTDILAPEGYEKLSLAVKIDACSRIEL